LGLGLGLRLGLGLGLRLWLGLGLRLFGRGTSIGGHRALGVIVDLAQFGDALLVRGGVLCGFKVPFGSVGVRSRLELRIHELRRFGQLRARNLRLRLRLRVRQNRRENQASGERRECQPHDNPSLAREPA